MNIRVPSPVRTTQAAEGLPRRAFTVADVERMVDVGLLAEDERVELIGGELVPMSPKGIRHETLKRMLLRSWTGLGRPLKSASGQALDLLIEATLRLDDDTYLEPDIVAVPQSVALRDLSGPAVLLAVELADSSLRFDLGRKARLYAAHGIGELWVIDGRRLLVHVHRHPGPDGYGSVVVLDSRTTAAALAAPDLRVRLDDLDLAGLAPADPDVPDPDLAD